MGLHLQLRHGVLATPGGVAQNGEGELAAVRLREEEQLTLGSAGGSGELAVVDKRRELFFFHNVRIHLDDVAGLRARGLAAPASISRRARNRK